MILRTCIFTVKVLIFVFTDSGRPLAFGFLFLFVLFQKTFRSPDNFKQKHSLTFSLCKRCFSCYLLYPPCLRDHTECPVSACTCKCMQLDTTGNLVPSDSSWTRGRTSRTRAEHQTRTSPGLARLLLTRRMRDDGREASSIVLCSGCS